MYTEPARGRSISRGSSSSSLYERAVASGAVADPYGRTRSTSGQSTSPGASYSPPQTSSLNSLGIGTAVMQVEPGSFGSTSSDGRGRQPRGGIQTARRVSDDERQQNGLEDSSDEDETSSEEDEASSDEENDTAITLRGADSGTATPVDGVSFSRRHMSTSSEAMKQSHRAAFDQDDDGGTLEEVSHSTEEPGFDGRPVSSAADAGRDGEGATHARAAPSISNKGPSQPKLVNAEEDDGGRLFDSPHWPSSPQFMSGTNLPSLVPSEAKEAGQNRTASAIGAHLQWADSDSPRPSAARNSLLRNLSSSSQGASARGTSPSKTFPARVQRVAANHDNNDDDDSDEQSDPASNGYSYGFSLSDEEEEDENRGYVGRAVDLAGALWTVGRGMVWGGGGGGR